MVATTVVAALNAELGGDGKQVINPPISGIVAHRFEQLGSPVHTFCSVANLWIALDSSESRLLSWRL